MLSPPALRKFARLSNLKLHSCDLLSISSCIGYFRSFNQLNRECDLLFALSDEIQCRFLACEFFHAFCFDEVTTERKRNLSQIFHKLRENPEYPRHPQDQKYSHERSQDDDDGLRDWDSAPSNQRDDRPNDDCGDGDLNQEGDHA